MSLVILENKCFGMGDAVCYCWCYHTLKENGHNALVNPVRHHSIFRVFGVPESEWVSFPAPKSFHDKKGTPGRGWIRNWVWEWVGQDLEPVRPPYLEDPKDGEWADRHWSGRDLSVGSTRRILIFPEVVYASRDWGRSHWAAVARLLYNQGYNVVVVTQKYDPNHPYPWCQGGHSQAQVAALCARADLVMGNDSGPVHIAGTIGVKTLVVCGPSPKGWFFEHAPNIEECRVSSSEMSCVGCNWAYDHGRKFTGACSKSCAALASYSPLRLVTRVKELFDECEPKTPLLVNIRKGRRPRQFVPVPGLDRVPGGSGSSGVRDRGVRRRQFLCDPVTPIRSEASVFQLA